MFHPAPRRTWFRAPRRRVRPHARGDRHRDSAMSTHAFAAPPPLHGPRIRPRHQPCRAPVSEQPLLSATGVGDGTPRGRGRVRRVRVVAFSSFSSRSVPTTTQAPAVGVDIPLAPRRHPNLLAHVPPHPHYARGTRHVARAFGAQETFVGEEDEKTKKIKPRALDATSTRLQPFFFALVLSRKYKSTMFFLPPVAKL